MGRFVQQLWPNLVTLVFVNLVINLLDHLGVKSMPSSQFDITQGLVGAVLSLLLVFRTNSAYERYYEGKKAYGVVTNQVRQIIMNAHAFLAFHEDASGHLNARYQPAAELRERAHEAEVVHELRERVRRQANVLLGVLRQDLREKRCGFVPECALHEVPYNKRTWILDPSRPRLVDMLTPREVATSRRRSRRTARSRNARRATSRSF